jgi:hypothetical protein
LLIYNLLYRERVLSKCSQRYYLRRCYRPMPGHLKLFSKSSGHCLLSLLSVGGTSVRAAINLFVCLVFLFLYLMAWECMTSLMKGIFRSSCKVWLEIYHGAFVIILKVLDWYVVCSILMFDGLAHPHSSIPYVHKLVMYKSYLEELSAVHMCWFLELYVCPRINTTFIHEQHTNNIGWITLILIINLMFHFNLILNINFNTWFKS